MSATPPPSLPGTLLYGRTAAGQNVPVKVDAAGLLAGGGNPFDQDLNTTDDVVFATITATDSTLGGCEVTDLDVTHTFRMDERLFANAPVSPVTGDMFNCSDSETNVWGANITTGLGANHVLARYNGVHWTVVGK